MLTKYLITNFSDFQLTCLGGFIVHESVFFLSGLPFILFERAGWFGKYKIQKKNNTPEAQTKCITRLVMYHLCVNLPILLVTYPVFKFMGTRSTLPLPSWYATPFGLTSEYAHPAEILFLGAATIVGPALTGPHLITIYLWVSLRILETVEAHSGYHFPWSPSNFLPLYGGSDFHDYHHRLLYTKSGNYSSTFVYMDWIFGTDKGYRKLKSLKESEREAEGKDMEAGIMELTYKLITGNPDKSEDLARPLIVTHPVYAPRDETFEEIKKNTFSAGRLKVLLHNLVPLVAGDRFACLRDNEFARLALAGINPEFSIVSKIDIAVNGPPDSAITRDLIEQELNELSAIEGKRLFIIDYHDMLLPFIGKMNSVAKSKSYASFFYTSRGVPKPIIIKLSLPPTPSSPRNKMSGFIVDVQQSSY
ncbi:Methylsterol monooxygenase 2-1 [Capsicum annuum]|nr:Methylsterol monooxygenase 2-1 [Capsicum annuum]